MATRSKPDKVVQQAWAELEEWGRDPELNELDALMWRTERVPDASWTGVVVMLLDSTPDWERLCQLYEWGTRKVPRMRDRVIDPLLPVGRPMWAPDPEFAISDHLFRVTLPAPGTMSQLLSWAERIAVKPLDRDRPPWRTFLVEGLEGGQAAWVMQCHHVLMDGGSATQLFGRVLNRSRALPTDVEWPESPSTDGPGPLEVTGRQLARQLAVSPRLARRVLKGARSALASPGDALRYAASLGRVVSPPRRSRSQVLRGGRREVWRFGMLECSLADLKAAGKAVGGTVNDAFVCAVLGGLRRYAANFGEHLDDVPISMPVSVRKESEMGGNRFTGAFFAAPSGIGDPVERMQAMRERVAAMRSEPALDFINTVMPVLNRTPAAMATTAMTALNNNAVLTTSSWPGVPYPVYVGGAELTHFFVFGPLPGTSMTAALCSHAGTCCIGVNVDGGVFEDTDLLWECLQESLDEILALGR
jgi:diacylglycerol O-acyltransferase